jgi:hypothetical protein
MVMTSGCRDRAAEEAPSGQAAAAATAEQPAPDASSNPIPVEIAVSPRQAEPGEQLWAAAPPGWIEGNRLATPSLRRAEFEPPGQPADPKNGPREQLVLESMPMDPSLDTINFIDQLSAELSATCEGFRDAPTFSGYENGYPTTVRLLSCPLRKASETAKVTLIKAIAGNAHFYVLVREKEGPASAGLPANADEIAAWTLHLKRTLVCDTTNAEHPCPRLENAGP